MIINSAISILFLRKIPILPDDILRRTIRKMLPYKKPKGREAFKRVKVFVGNPKNLPIDEKISHKLNTNKYITLGELSKHLGAKF